LYILGTLEIEKKDETSYKRIAGITYNACNLTTSNKSIKTTNSQSCCKSTKAISGEILEQEREGDMSDCNYQIGQGQHTTA